MRHVSSVAASALLAAGPAALAQAPRFADLHRMLPFEAPTTATCLLIADLDGDADLDIWVGHDDAQSRLYLNQGTASFLAATSNLPQISDETYAGALGDVDGDGDLDILVGNEGQDRLLLNGGNASFSDGTALLPVFSDDTSAV